MKVGLKAGTYVMNLDPDFYIWDDESSINCDYSISFTANNYFEIENNNSVAKATVLNLGYMYSGVYGEEDYNSNYMDYFKISLTKGVKYRIKMGNFDALEATTTIIYLIDPSGKEEIPSLGYSLSKKTDGTYNYYDFTAPSTGTYYIKLWNHGNGVPVDYKIGVYKLASSLKITGIPTTKAYTGKAIKPIVTVKDGSKTLKKGTDYTVTYGTNKNTGKATVKILGKSTYAGSVTKTFYIVPKAPTSLKLTGAKKSIKVSYKKATGASGYQIAYSTKKSSGYKTVTTTSLSKSLSKLTAKKTYYVKVRAYKTVSGKKYYSSYTSVKSVKTK